MLFNTLIRLRTVVAHFLQATFSPSSRNADGVMWVTIKTAGFRWEAELLQHLLVAHETPARVVDLGIESYMGQGSPAALQVHLEDEQAARLLLSSLTETADETTEAPK